MAEKKTKKPVDNAAEPAPVEKQRKSNSETFIRITDKGNPVPPNCKLPPQAQVILNTIEAAGANGIKRDQLIAALKGVLQTRQPEGRIVSYYQKLLVDSGALKVTQD